MKPQNIEIKNYDYPLPDNRIARYPLSRRDESKMLCWDGNTITDASFKQLPDILPPKTLIVMNNTRVIRARMHFRKSTGALIEIFCLEPHLPADYQLMFQETNNCEWMCLVGNLKKWKDGDLVQQLPDGETLTARHLGSGESGSQIIGFSWTGGKDFAEILMQIGELPIPPYLGRETEQSDLTTYQTVYSRIKGSVAAPTAGLHFTPEVLSELDAHNIERTEVTLHVGAGTFKPVKSEHIGGHEMHTEHIVVTAETIRRLIAHGGKCMAIGTTSVRTLESLYYIGLYLKSHKDSYETISEEQLQVKQWTPYDENVRILSSTTSSVDSLSYILEYLECNKLNALHTATQIIIVPSYEYHIVNRMLTNFHQPQSTLLLLISAFIGDDTWHKIYNHALNSNYRFLSYGDCCLLNDKA